MADQVTIHQYLTGWIRYTDLKCDTNINKTNTGQIAKNNSCKLTGTNIKARKLILILGSFQFGHGCEGLKSWRWL